MIETGTGTRAILPDGRAIAGKTGDNPRGAGMRGLLGLARIILPGFGWVMMTMRGWRMSRAGSLPADIWREDDGADSRRFAVACVVC